MTHQGTWPTDWDEEFKDMDLREAVFSALGGASACWDNLEGAGVFQSENAQAIGDALLRRVTL